VGLDLTGTMPYFGSPSADIAADFTPDQRRDVTIRKQILWESSEATDAEARAMEVRLIRELGRIVRRSGITDVRRSSHDCYAGGVRSPDGWPWEACWTSKASWLPPTGYQASCRSILPRSRSVTVTPSDGQNVTV
jgi:hypothetical protein